MRYRIAITEGSFSVDETLDGATEAEIAAEFRRRVERRAPWAIRLVMKALDDRAFWARIVQAHNRQAAAAEPAPCNAREFLEFGVRTGYAQRLSG